MRSQDDQPSVRVAAKGNALCREPRALLLPGLVAGELVQFNGA
jgi:hypothetical protein